MPNCSDIPYITPVNLTKPIAENEQKILILGKKAKTKNMTYKFDTKSLTTCFCFFHSPPHFNFFAPFTFLLQMGEWNRQWKISKKS